MYAVFAVSVQFAPETFGRAMGEAGADDEAAPAVNGSTASASGS